MSHSGFGAGEVVSSVAVVLVVVSLVVTGVVVVVSSPGMTQ